MKSLSSFLSLVLIPLIAVSPIRAQLPPAPAAPEATLQLRVLESCLDRPYYSAVAIVLLLELDGV